MKKKSYLDAYFALTFVKLNSFFSLLVSEIHNPHHEGLTRKIKSFLLKERYFISITGKKKL